MNYNIDEVFEAFTFNLSKKEVSQKQIRNEIQYDGTYKEIQEDKILFERTEEDLVTVATASTALSQATVHNVNVLSEKLSQAESDNHKLKKKSPILKQRYTKGENWMMRPHRFEKPFWISMQNSMM